MSRPRFSRTSSSSCVDPDDVVHVAGERGAEDAHDPDRVLVEVRLHVVGADRVLALRQRHDPRLDVEVAAELLPDDVHVAPEDQVGPVDREVRGLPAFPPLPLQRERAQHDRLGRALGPAPGGLARSVEQVGQHPDAPLLDLRRDRVLRVVDEVAVQVLRDDPLRLRLHPGGDERGQVALRVALHGEVHVHQPHGVRRGHAALRGTSRTGRPRSGNGCRRARLPRRRRARCGSCPERSMPQGPQTSPVWMIPATAKQAAPAKVPQFTRPTLTDSEVAGRTNEARPARKNRTDPTWLIATIHQFTSPASSRTRPCPTESIARCPETRKQTQPRMSGSQIQPLDCRGVRPAAKAATRLTANSSVPTNSTTALCQSRDRAVAATTDSQPPRLKNTPPTRYVTFTAMSSAPFSARNAPRENREPPRVNAAPARTPSRAARRLGGVTSWSRPPDLRRRPRPFRAPCRPRSRRTPGPRPRPRPHRARAA